MKKKHILIVDDNEFFIQQQIGYLGKNRYEFQTAETGKEALEKVRSENLDLILLDQYMEDMTGPDVCRAVKADSSTAHIPIVIVSSGEREISRLLGAQAGCDGIIFKPIHRDLLVVMVEELLGLNDRKWKRASISIPCEIECEGRKTTGTIHSLSGGGALVEVDIALMRGDTCGITFDLPLTDKNIKVGTAAVVWKDNINGGETEGVGLQFLAIYPDNQEAVDEYVCSLLGYEK